MDFGLSQEQTLLGDTVARFLGDRCSTDRVRAVMAAGDGHDRDLWAGLQELGIGALAVPEAAGGLGSELLDLALVSEALGYAAAPGPFLGAAMAAIALAAGESDESWLAKSATGEALGTVAIGERGGRWDADQLQATVEGGRLSAAKTMVPYADVADYFVVAARDGDTAALWLVEGGQPGIETTALVGNDATRRLHAVTFEDVAARRVGGEAAFAKVRDAGLILVAADAFGGARRCLEMATAYALEREQFGQVIGAFQAVKHQLANLATDLEPSRSLVWYAAHAWDRIPDDAPRHAALAKARSCDLYDRAARDSTELHGGIAFTWEFDLHLWFRRSIFDRSFLGDASYHRARAAALAGW